MFQKILIFLFLLLVLISGCQKKNQGDKVLHVSLKGDIPTIDPALGFDIVSCTIIYQMYEPLYEYEYLKRPYTLKPLLAEDMPLIEDGGKRYTIKIKKNIPYHFNAEFSPDMTGPAPRFVKAEDFITAIKRIAFTPTASTGWWLFENRIKGLDEFRTQAGSDLKNLSMLKVSGLIAKDDHTLIIELNNPYPQLINALAMNFSAPLPLEKVLELENRLENFDKLGKHDLGTGPFTLESYNPPLTLKVKKYTGYHHGQYPSKGDRMANDLKLLEDANRPLPFLDGVDFQVIKEDSTRWLSFLSGKIDYIELPKDAYESAITPTGELTKEILAKNSGIKLQISPALTYSWLSFNMQDPIVGKNKNLRLAIAHAIDMDRYIALFTNNLGLKSNSIYPPGIPGYNPSKQLPYTYSIEKAKEYLKLAGFPEGKGLATIRFDMRGTDTLKRQMADFIQGELKKIGIQTEIIPNTFPAFLKRSRNGELQFWQGGWIMDYPDAENILQLLISENKTPGTNTANFSNPKFDEKFQKLALLSDGAEKFELMDEMEKMVLEEIPWIMQFYQRSYILTQDRVKNLRYSDLIYGSFKYVKIE